MQIQGIGFLLVTALAVFLASPSLASERLDSSDATACIPRFAFVVFSVRGPGGEIPDGLSASTRELESGEPVENTHGIALPRSIFLADDSMLDRLRDGDLDLVTTVRAGDREYELIHRVGLDPTGCHVVMKDGPAELVLED